MLDDDRDSPSSTVGDSRDSSELLLRETLFEDDLSKAAIDELLECDLSSLFSD